EGALLGNRVEQLADLIWSRACLANQGHLRLADLHHLGARRDQREQRPDQDPSRLARGHRNVEDVEVTGLVVLSYLLHATLSLHAPTSQCVSFTVVRLPQPRRRDTTAPSRAAATTASTGPGARCADRRPSDEAAPGAGTRTTRACRQAEHRRSAARDRWSPMRAAERRTMPSGGRGHPAEPCPRRPGAAEPSGFVPGSSAHL